MMNTLVTGIHHITSLASDAQKNVDFYAGILGLRLVKKTINFDVLEIYHLYYGNEEGSPGTIMTFFPYPGIPQGRKGKGQLTVTSFSIPEHSIDYWTKRLDKFHIPYEKPEQRFSETVIYFEDLDGLGLELVANQLDNRSSFTYGNIPSQFAIKGFYGITLVEECYEKTANLLVNQVDHKFIAETENRFRYSASDKPGDFVDILCSPEALKGLSGYGTVHHVAFATETDITQLAARERLLEFGLDVTPVLNREYFLSIYFREPGGVLFEIATVSPGFSVDEPFEHLGETLKLPPWEEPNRASIEQVLPPIKLNLKKYVD
ncbi:ring-cleaving dioxygenase [Candidatus Rhabdochlamydia sp. T3358]|uniref:ring-cleaving dioxygenase n=1 Tax=Candidatus Rhabdochlamydia sp. T3358 TaxID=2099795 RepID=UPI0010B7E689|nr:ring-cleaving dioxygenase [Candidatus Rhabdochlamydia sp. T3358]VHO05198.1 Putative ring-cleaving dioxygenase MhqO [Candidatus Rhabdochlamydia sp. T3358]